MPSSHPDLMGPVAHQILKHKPQSIIEVGIGMGKYGLIAREYTDVWAERFYSNEWRTILHGVEVHSKYRNPAWSIYDRVFIGNALKVLRQPLPFAPYDLALMIDVLEHFEKPQAMTMIGLLKNVGRKVLVSYHNCDQKDVRDNKHEDHLSKWSASDFPEGSRICGDSDWGLHLLV